MPKKKGRTSRLTKALALRICERIAQGESVRSICKDESMPHSSTVFRWVIEDKEAYQSFQEQYARACEIRAEQLSDECIEIADSVTPTGNPGTGEAGAKVQKAKLQIDSRKWKMGQLSPKRHAEKPAVEINNNNSNTGDVITRTQEEDEAFIAKFKEAMEGEEGNE